MKHKARIRSALCMVLSFCLTALLFLFSVCSMLEATFFNDRYILDTMNSIHYFDDLKNELVNSLTDLGYASGLESSFFSDVVDDVMLQEDTQAYIKAFYSGEPAVVDVTLFKQHFNEALDVYIADKQIDAQSVSSSGREYLIKEAAKIYANGIKLPLFTTLANYVYHLQMPLLIATIGSGLLALGICLLLFFTIQWKHRAFRYMCYGFSGAFLSVVLLPAAVFLSGKITQVNLQTRSVYHLFVACMNGFFSGFFVVAICLLLLSVIMWFLYRNRYKKVSAKF